MTKHPNRETLVSLCYHYAIAWVPKHKTKSLGNPPPPPKKRKKQNKTQQKTKTCSIKIQVQNFYNQFVWKLEVLQYITVVGKSKQVHALVWNCVEWWPVSHIKNNHIHANIHVHVFSFKSTLNDIYVGMMT